MENNKQIEKALNATWVESKKVNKEGLNNFFKDLWKRKEEEAEAEAKGINVTNKPQTFFIITEVKTSKKEIKK